MDYVYTTTVKLHFADALQAAIDALKAEGFGIVSQIDMSKKFKEALDVDFKKYTILGACNPQYAYQAVLVEEMVGSMLPCNVVVVEKEEKFTEIAAINPKASMMAIENPALEPLADEVTMRLHRVINNLASVYQ